MTYDEQLKAAGEKKEETAEESDFLPQIRIKLKIDARAATPAGPAFTQQPLKLVPPPGTTVFHGCSMMPPQGLQQITPQQAQPQSAEFNMLTGAEKVYLKWWGLEVSHA